MDVYLGKNPVDAKMKPQQMKQLKSFGVDVYDK